MVRLRFLWGYQKFLSGGDDLTLVTYGANVRIALSVLPLLAREGVRTELIDVRTLLPFDREGVIAESVRKTNAVLFLDEDVPGGASAYMMQQVLERQGVWDDLDAPPATLTAREHRPAYGSDGDYYSKPGEDDLFRKVMNIMHERDPQRFRYIPY